MMPLCSEILAFDPPFVRNSSMVKVEFTSGNPISGWKVMLPILSVFSSSSMQDARINAMQVKDTHAAPKCNLFIKWGIGPSVYGLAALGKRKAKRNTSFFCLLPERLPMYSDALPPFLGSWSTPGTLGC